MRTLHLVGAASVALLALAACQKKAEDAASAPSATSDSATPAATAPGSAASGAASAGAMSSSNAPTGTGGAPPPK